MGLCGSKDGSSNGDPKKDYTDLHGLNSVAAGLVVYLPTTGPLTARDYKERLSSSEGTQVAFFPQSGFTVRYAFVSQRGYYPDSLHKPNQDAYAIHTYFGGDPEQAFFGIFDGHGENGTQCANFARDKVPENLVNNPLFALAPEAAYHQAMVMTNNQLHRSEFDDSMSGTTAITVLLRGRMLYIANVGDSRAVLAERRGDAIVAHDLSYDQTPYRRDECERVKRCGAHVLTLDQLEGLKDPTIEHWGVEGDADAGDPPRLWAPNASTPGTAFTRSIGDSVAERIGVVAEPEVMSKQLTAAHPFLVIASDGVFEFLPSQSVVDMVSKFDDPQEACYSVAAESYRLWLQHETRTDDITMIVVQFQGLEDEVPQMATAMGLAGRESSVRGGLASQVLLKRQLTAHLPAIDQPVAPPWSVHSSSFSLTVPLAAHAFGKLTQHTQAAPYRNLAPAPITAPALTQEQRQLLEGAVRNNFLFVNLDSESMQRVFDVMERRAVQAGEMVIRQGEQGHHFYVVESGVYDVYIQQHPSQPATLVHTYLVQGNYRAAFGELALLYSKPRAATVLARTEGSLWMLHRDAFKVVLLQRNHEPRSIALALRNVEVLHPLNMAQLQQLMDVMEEVAYNKGDHIVRQGEAGHDFYVIMSGEVTCTVREYPGDEAEVPKVHRAEPAAVQEVLRLTTGQCFGERALLSSDNVRAANVVAAADRVVLLRIDRPRFEAHFGPLQASIDAQAAWRVRLPLHKQRMWQQLPHRPDGNATILQPSFRLDDLSARGLLYSTDCSALMLMEAVGAAGPGATAPYGAPAAPHGGMNGYAGGSNEVYTLRVTSVSDVITQGKQLLILRARSITRALEPSLFVPGVVRTFRDTRVLAEVLATVGLCTLDCLLVPQPLDEASAAFVAASVILGLEHLHWSQIIYRGLSLHSVIVTEAGQVQLVDFRFARQNEGRAYTLCGHPEYLAPEVVENKGHDQSVDLWSLGVFVYGLLTGDTPFAAAGDDELQIYRKILSRQLVFPPSLSPAACDLVNRLLQKDPSSRLGNLPGGWTELKNHPWFASIDWEAMHEHSSQPPAGLQDRIYHFEGVPYAHFDPRAETEGDTSWIKDF